MATVAQVLPDLTALASEARRRHPAIKASADSALALAKTIPPSTNISSLAETQLVFCSPFITAIESRSPRLVQTALPALTRLAQAGSLSDAHGTTMIAALYALAAPALPAETHLKTLQAVPALVQKYVRKDAAFVQLVAICSRMAAAPGSVVTSTAAATLQQVLGAPFDALRVPAPLQEAVRVDTRLFSAENIPQHHDNLVFHLDERERRCFQVAADLSAACAGEPPAWLPGGDARVRPEAALEILHTIVAQNRPVFHAQRELQAVLARRVAPLLVAVLEAPAPVYAMVVRALRLSQAVVASGVPGQAEATARFLAACNRVLLSGEMGADVDDAAAGLARPQWQKALVAETYRALFVSFDTVRVLYSGDGSVARDVLCDALDAMDAFLARGHTLLFTDPAAGIGDGSAAPLLSRASAALKTPMVDHLDRTEPPARVPELYVPWLVLQAVLGLASGVSGFVFALSAQTAQSNLEQDVDFVSALAAHVCAPLRVLFSRYLRCACDPESFHATVRALQKYTHAVGLLGLAAERDTLLVLLAQCIVYPARLAEEKPPVSQNLLALGESHLLALGGSLVESLGGSTSATQKQDSGLSSHAPRTFSSRQVVCLRAFSNLAVLLGSTLQGSWDLVWTTLQWVRYYLKGPDAYGAAVQLNTPKNTPEVHLSAQDIVGVRNSHDKLIESLAEYQYEPFCDAYNALFRIYCVEDGEPQQQDGRVGVCPYNKSYFLEMLIELATLDLKNFALIESNLWTETAYFFERLATNRGLAHQRRTHIVECYTAVIDTATRKAFKADKDTEVAANRSLNALFSFLQKLLQPGTAQELIVLSCETEMHLTVLVTLHHLIDDYDRFYVNSWDLVFMILETAFVNTEDDTVQSKKLVEKIVLLISTSFGSLKMILDEFLLTLPFNQLKSLIDTLVSFCSQKYDLNISFSSVSYFWLISDCIHSKIAKCDRREIESSLKSIKNIHQLEELLKNASHGSFELYQALNIYLLAKISYISSDDRNQVREGSIQTLFQILDTQGTDTQSWRLIYHIVFPELLDLRKIDPQLKSFSKKNTLPSLNLILSGLVSVYAKFITNFTEETTYYEFWTRLIEYMGAMLNLRWLELNLKVFQSFQDVLLFLRGSQDIPKSISRLLFDFWISVPIDYDFVKPEYQESLALFNASFKDLHNLMREDFTITETNQVLSIFNKCARYPVLKPGVNDSSKPSRLQGIVIDNLNCIEEYGERGEIQAAIIQQLAQISAFPYEIKSRIEAKLKSKFEGKLKIPTFLAVGQQAFESISPKLGEIKDLKILFEEDRFHRMMYDLLDIVRNKSEGVSAEKAEPLWASCNDLILKLTKRVVHENLHDIKDDTRIWDVLLDCITVTFEEGGEEKANVIQYEALTEVVLPAFFASKHDELINLFVRKIYLNSYLYKANETEIELMSGKDSYNALTDYRFETLFGTTAQVETESNRQMRMKCLKELFRIASTSGRGAAAAQDYLAIRAAFSIRRFIADGRLLSRKPLPQVQAEELLQVLDGCSKMGHALGTKQTRGLVKLLTQSVIYADRVQGLKSAMQDVLQLATSG